METQSATRHSTRAHMWICVKFRCNWLTCDRQIEIEISANASPQHWFRTNVKFHLFRCTDHGIAPLNGHSPQLRSQIPVNARNFTFCFSSNSIKFAIFSLYADFEGHARFNKTKLISTTIDAIGMQWALQRVTMSLFIDCIFQTAFGF